MKKKLIIGIIIISAFIFFFYPKDKYFSCGAIVCNKEEYDEMKIKKENTICLGFKKKASIITTEVDSLGCYGIFINTSNF